MRPGPVPLASGPVIEQLRANFAAAEVDVIDVKARLAANTAFVVVNALGTAIRYGNDLIRGKRGFKDAFMHTPRAFTKVKALMRELARKGGYDFTLQMQSLFDASVPGIPHFMYTDHTNRANLAYGPLGAARLYPSGWQELEQQAYERASLIFVRSTHVARSLETQYGIDADKVVLVYAGANAPISPAMRRRSPVAGPGPTILFVGMDWVRKGGPELLAAFRSVRRSSPAVRLVIAGCAPDVRELNVVVAGRVPLAEVSRLMASADIFCMPAHVEPFGVAYVEAMSHGLPVVASDIGAASDLVTDGVTGFLVRPGDGASLAHRLSTLVLDGELRVRLGEAGRRVAQEHYNWPAVGRKIASAIRSHLHEERSRRRWADELP